ncbi:transposable element Tc3 transposase [Trichonephila clavipes]|nr:transposable element Tc3 transposase [Trichonephila clavipes]
MLCGRHRASVDQVSEFDRGRLVAYRDCGLSFREKSVNVLDETKQLCDADLSSLDAGRNDGPTRPITPPCCTTARDARRIVRMAMMDHAATSRTIAQQIQSVLHHSVSARTIRRRLQQSGMPARRPLLRLPLTGNQW